MEKQTEYSEVSIVFSANTLRLVVTTENAKKFVQLYIDYIDGGYSQKNVLAVNKETFVINWKDCQAIFTSPASNYNDKALENQTRIIKMQQEILKATKGDDEPWKQNGENDEI